MKEQFLDEQDPQSDNKIISSLLIYTEEDGSIYFSCDWSDVNEAQMSIGTMLYKLKEGGLVEEIMENLKSRCVLEDRAEDYEKILTLYNSLKILKDSTSEVSKDEVVIKPLEATTF